MSAALIVGDLGRMHHEGMGVDLHRSLRLSFGWCSTQTDVEAATTALTGILQDLRALRHDPHDRPLDRPLDRP